MGDGGRGEEKKESEDREKVQRNGGAGGWGGRQMQGLGRRAFLFYGDGKESFYMHNAFLNMYSRALEK